MKLKMVVELNYDAELMHGKDPEAIQWFRNDILLNGECYLFSNEIGDTIGEVDILEVEGD